MNTRVIPTRLHGALDYLSTPALVAAPELLRLNGARGSTVPPRVAGVGAGVYSALTDYELGVRRIIPMRAHLTLDALSGALLALSPWMFGSARQGVRHWLPHAVIGASEIGIALATQTEPPRRRRSRVLSTVGSLPVPARVLLAGLAIGAAGAAAYAGRRRLFQVAAVAAEAVEEVADTIEDAADAVEDFAEDVAEAARERANAGTEQPEAS